MSIICIADSEGRVTLPGLANAKVIVETISEDEFRIRRAKAASEEEVRFPEEDMPLELSERDALMILELMENPPPPNEAALKAAKRFKEKYG